MIKLICPFTFSVSPYNLQSSRFIRTKFLLSKFYETNKRFHHIELVTDEESHKLLDYIKFDSIKYVDTSLFNYVDDFKIQLLQNLNKDEVIVDFDVYLKKPLHISTEHSIVIERYEESFAEDIYRNLIKDSDIEFDKSYYLNILNLDKVPNIGILKINDTDLLSYYTSLYTTKSTEFKLKATTQKINHGKYSVLFGQLLLRQIINNFNYSVFDAKSYSNNSYIHLNGDNKYDSSLEQLKKIIDEKTLL